MSSSLTTSTRWRCSKGTSIRTVGLCHGIQGTAWALSHFLKIPLEEINFIAAGTNHLAFFIKLECHGENLYPRLREIIESPDWGNHERVRFELFKRFGYFGGESSEHAAEYVPYFIRRDREDLIEEHGDMLPQYT